MTHINLIRALAAEIREEVGRVKLPVEYAETETPDDLTKINVFEQYLPKDIFEETSYYPLVLVEWLGTTDDLKGISTAIIGLTIGVYAHEGDGWVDAFYLMERIRQRLLRRRLIAQKFRLTDEPTFQPPSEQPAPFFFITANLPYEMFQPQEEL